jgi:hypothetical protein
LKNTHLFRGAKIKENWIGNPTSYLLIQGFVVLCHGFQAHGHTGKTPIVVNVLHRYFPAKIGKKNNGKIGTFIGCGISQW